MSFVKRLTNLGRGLWKTRGTWSGDREQVLDAELAQGAPPRSSTRSVEPTVRARHSSPVEDLAALERALRDGELGEVEFRRRRERIMRQAVGEGDSDEKPRTSGKKSL